MSTELGVMPHTGRDNEMLQFTQFYGGRRHGVMLQVTQAPDRYIQLTRKDARRLRLWLELWEEDQP